jgi:hypothetical protein
VLPAWVCSDSPTSFYNWVTPVSNTSPALRLGSVAREVPVVRKNAVLERGNLFKGGAAILADSQNGDIIVLSPVI